MIKEFMKWHGPVVVVGMFVTQIFMAEMIVERGCFAIGGEMFILPVMMLVTELFREMHNDGLAKVLLRRKVRRRRRRRPE